MFRSHLTNVIHASSIIVIIALSLLASGCRRGLDRPNAEGELLIPIATTTLNIGNILGDSIAQTNSDESITLVYRSTLLSAKLGSFKELETREFNQTAKLQSLSLGTQTAIRTVSLGQVAASMGAFGQILISQHGSNGILPPVPGLSYGPLAVDGTQFFETVTLDSGYMDITIENGFPSALSNIQFEIRNESDSSLIGQQSFSFVAAGATDTKTIDLAGKTVEGNLIGNITNFDVVGSNGQNVPIDTSDQIIVTISVRDMKVNSATAIFPAQDIINLNDTAEMAGPGVNDLRITKAKAAKGIVNLRVVSTVEDTMYFDYLIPSGTLNGMPFEIHEKINPAPANGSIEKTFQYSVDGYTFDLTGAPLINHYNAFYSELTGRIDSTGRVVSLSLDDSLLLFVQLSDFIPEYAEGYLGHADSVIGPTTIPIDLFQNVTSGSIDFEEVKLNIGVSNGNNVPFNIDLMMLNAQNSRSGHQVAMDLSELPNPLEIQGAEDIFTSWSNEWNILNAIQNLNEALNIFPDQFSAQVRLISNPDQDTSDYSQFAIDTNLIEAYADLEVPLSFIAKDLTLQDTATFDASSFENPEFIKAGTIYLIAQNSYPMEAAIDLRFLDENNFLMETVAFDTTIASGSTSAPNETILEWEFDAESVETISQSQKVVFTLRFNTEGTSHQKIYSTENIDLKLTTRFQYQTTE